MKRIIVIEDDESLRDLFTHMLLDGGYHVLSAENGKRGIEILEREGVDAVITDIIMPVQDGIETIQFLRKHHPDVKIIAMSGGGRGDAADYLLMARMMGAEQTLVKPFTPRQLLTAVCEAVG